MKPRIWLLCLLMVALGFALRCYALESKAYGNDEATTSLRVAGATLAGYQQLFDGHPRTIAQLRAYQERLPASSVWDVQRSLASEDPQHPPLYYDLERFWMNVDSGVGGHRRISVLFGTLAIPAMGWFVFEVFGSLPAALVAMALVSVSPFFVLYSQQAREYALWALWVMLASALLLRLLRTSSTSFVAWSCYAVLIACSALTDILAIGVGFAHLWVIVRETGFRRANRRALLALAMAALCFSLLWMPAILGNRIAVTNNTFLALALPLQVFVAKWLVNISTVVVDFGLLPIGYAPRLMIELGALLAGATLIGVACAIWWAARYLSAQSKNMVFALLIVPALLLLLPDLMRHEGRSTAARYMVPTWVALEALLAGGIAALLSRWRSAGIAVVVLALGAGVTSAALRAPVPVWWTDWSAYGVVAQAKSINKLPPEAEVAYVQEDAAWDFSVMELANCLPPNRIFRLYAHLADFVNTKAAPTYLLDPAPSLLKRLRAIGYRVNALPLGMTQMGPALLKKNGSPKGDEGSLPIALWQVERRVGNG